VTDAQPRARRQKGFPRCSAASSLPLSEQPGAGKTGVAAAIARTFAYTGLPVRLVRATGGDGERAAEDAAYYASLSFAPGSPAAPVDPGQVAPPVDNAIVVDDYRVLNAEGLRYDDEFVKHKILDAIGDLYIDSKPMLAAYTSFKGGHALNNKLMRKLLADPSAYEIASFDDESQAPAGFAELAPAW